MGAIFFDRVAGGLGRGGRADAGGAQGVQRPLAGGPLLAGPTRDGEGEVSTGRDPQVSRAAPSKPVRMLWNTAIQTAEQHTLSPNLWRDAL